MRIAEPACRECGSRALSELEPMLWRCRECLTEGSATYRLDAVLERRSYVHAVLAVRGVPEGERKAAARREHPELYDDARRARLNDELAGWQARMAMGRLVATVAAA